MDTSFLDIFKTVAIGLGGSVVVAVLFLYPFWRCLSRAGFSPAWSLVILIPYCWPFTIAGVAATLAFVPWPALAGPAEATSWRALSRNRWISLPREEAARHHLYGLQGWLLTFYVLYALGFVVQLIMKIVPSLYGTDVDDEYLNLYGIGPAQGMFINVVNLVYGLLMLIFMPLKRSWVPASIITCALLSWLIFVAVITIYGTVNLQVNLYFLFGGSFAGLYAWYWLQSKRVNVTYRNRVPAAPATD